MSKSASRGVFISYRRQDTQHVAGRLYDRLVERFGSASVFMDVDSIDPGMEFGEAIDRAIERCRVLLVLIGQTWVNCTDDAGRRRLDDADDLVAAEIKTALAKGLRVVPITVDGAALPRRADLPEELAPLMLRQAVRVEHETFRSDVQPLLDAIERALEEPAEQRPPARPIVERPADVVPPTSEPPIVVVSDAPTEVSGLERVRRALHLNPILGPVAVLALSTILFSILNGRFLSAANLGLILQQVSVIGTLALGQTLVILTAGIDLSAGAIAVFSSILMASFATKLGIPGVLALVIGLVLGTMMGAFNGLMVTLTKLPPFIVTLGTLSIFFSLNDVVSGSETIRGSDMPAIMTATGNSALGIGNFRITWGSIVMLALYAIFWYLLSKTAWRRQVYATGDDVKAARLAGIPTDRVLLTVYAAAGLVYAIGAWLLMGRLASASPNVGTTYNLDSITAAVIGGTSLFGGRGMVLGTLIGALIVGTLSDGLQLAGVDVVWQGFAIGSLVLVAVSIDQWIRTVKV